MEKEVSIALITLTLIGTVSVKSWNDLARSKKIKKAINSRNPALLYLTIREINKKEKQTTRKEFANFLKNHELLQEIKETLEKGEYGACNKTILELTDNELTINELEKIKEVINKAYEISAPIACRRKMDF